MNIVFFLPSIKNKGGVERALISLLNTLVLNRSHKIFLFVFNYNLNHTSYQLDKNVVIVNLGITNYKIQYITLIKRIRSEIIRYKITHFVTVETMSLLFTFLPLLTLIKRPKLIVWEHFNFNNDNGRKSRVFFRKLSAKYADLIVTLTSRDVLTWKENLSIVNKITFIYNISPFQEVNSVYNLKSKKVISIGRYVHVKGFDRLIHIWSLLEKKYDIGDWQLAIIGYGELHGELQNLIYKLGSNSIYLINGESDVSKYYKEAALYCMSSYHEGLPMVLIEAQSFGLPAISFDIYSGPSEILSEGSGLLVKDCDLEGYVEGIYKLICSEDMRKEMSCKALLNREKFKENKIANLWLENFQNL